ncbi:MAG TPA: LEA type 2 family protein [Gemmatimonadaceae bacterium]|jgi:LEA14-like dessication related protein|nr:LEA type 2 family protein [Gemmatimonadaceae bacterium]
MTFRPFKRASTLVLLLALATVALGGCATMARQAMADPVVAVKDVVVKGIGTQGGSLDVILDVYNPNEFRMDATKITYELWVDSSRVADGAISKLVTLGNKQRSDITVPVNFTYNEMRAVMNQFMLKGVVDYRVKGQFTVVTPFGNITRPYSGVGRLNSMP